MKALKITKFQFRSNLSDAGLREFSSFAMGLGTAEDGAETLAYGFGPSSFVTLTAPTASSLSPNSFGVELVGPIWDSVHDRGTT